MIIVLRTSKNGPFFQTTIFPGLSRSWVSLLIKRFVFEPRSSMKMRAACIGIGKLVHCRGLNNDKYSGPMFLISYNALHTSTMPQHDIRNYLGLRTYMYICLCIYICVHMYIYIYTYMSTRIYIYMYMFAYTYVYIHMYIYICMCLQMHVYIDMCIYIYIYTYQCVFLSHCR